MAKSKKTKDCKCTKKEKGNPKYGRGVCCLSGCVRPTVRDRITWKRALGKISRMKEMDFSVLGY